MKPMRPDLRPERADLRPRMASGVGGDIRRKTEKQKTEKQKPKKKSGLTKEDPGLGLLDFK